MRCAPSSRALALCVLPLATALLAGCDRDETLAGHGAAGASWQLVSLDGSAPGAAASLSFPAPGRIAGQAPCNSFSGALTAPYPWFDTGPLAVTRRACRDLPAEQAFFAALQAMTQAEVQGDTLLLSNEAGREMVFTAQR